MVLYHVLLYKVVKFEVSMKFRSFLDQLRDDQFKKKSLLCLELFQRRCKHCRIRLFEYFLSFNMKFDTFWKMFLILDYDIKENMLC
jgi:hypothetical protein